ncbi:Variant-specific surface protein [Giardia duodenalis]|uniref:Variant-specific surface protein n=1 Tax=Giardia intestinalis TaxID=5741 RepID=V6TNX2_GIAIN|nr:Variant-specific surface protein [Giardia intestinalis]
MGCSVCEEGYYLDNADRTCKSCNRCATCTDANICTSCPEGTYLKSDNTCVEKSGCTGNTYPDPETRTCKESGIADCTTCTYNATVSKPQCTACGGSKTLVKVEVDGTTICVDAAGCAADNQAGSHFLSTDSQKCILCNDKSDTSNQGIEGCGTCKKAAPDQALTCTACTDGYYDSGNGNPATCVACGANCATCTEGGNDKCSTCKSGYFLVDAGESKKCVACDSIPDGGREGCSTCSNTNAFKCTDCKSNYRKQQNGGASDDYTCTKTCEDETACGGTAGACGAIVVGGDGSMTCYCSQCRQQ